MMTDVCSGEKEDQRLRRMHTTNPMDYHLGPVSEQHVFLIILNAIHEVVIFDCT